MDCPSPRVDGDRLWRSIMEMARIGATPAGGCRRLALTDEDKAGRDLFVSWCRDAGCRISVDDMGNIFARRPGRREGLPAVATGSHLDTQPHGGRFDGVYGVLAGLEVIRTLNEHGVETEAPVDVVVWTNEEGARFAPAMLASGVFAGLFDRAFALGRTDGNGRTLGAELDRIGYLGDEPCGDRAFDSYFEAHIEQGPILERKGRTIGVVLGGQGQRWYDVTLGGQDAHAGSTPLAGRRDALVAAAGVVFAARHAALDHSPKAVGTVGQLDVIPNSRNTVPGLVRLAVDLRHPDDEVLAEMDASFRGRTEAACRSESVALEIDEIWRNPAVHFDRDCVDAVRNAARSLGYFHLDMVSGAGHDACQICHTTPAAMIFVPCAGGVSHNEAESAKPADLEAGCNVLLQAVMHRSRSARRLANQPTSQQGGLS
ncbi:MAG: Zn-dependent hydrolase [bacterium]|nr:Zn-dependent hydrolase [bacterium]